MAANQSQCPNEALELALWLHVTSDLRGLSQPPVQFTNTAESASRHRKSRSLPNCSNFEAIPKDAVVAPGLNVIFDPKDINKASDNLKCRTHSGKVVSMLCVECDVFVCSECKIGHHVHHKTQDIAAIAVEANWELSKKKSMVEDIYNKLVNNVKRREQDLKEFQAKKALVEHEINRRYDMIVNQAQKLLLDALTKLQSCNEKYVQKVRKELDDVRKGLEEARYLYQRIEEAEIKGDRSLVRGSEAVITKLMAVGQLNQACRLVHQSVLPDDFAMFKTMKTFIGTCEVVTLPRVGEEEQGLVGKEVYQCGDHDDVTVFSLKANTYNDFNVSFDPFCYNPHPPAKFYKQNEPHDITIKIGEDKKQYGRKSFSLLNGCLSVCITDHFSFYCKATWSSYSFVLNNKNNYCDVKRLKLEIDKWKTTDLFKIQSKSCRAFDVDSSQQYFVVVEEGEKPANQRKVLLYRRPDSYITVTAVDTYTSPITPFQPADVCFYTVPGQTGTKVLLIADELNDALHVAKVKDDHVTFTHFLCPGCPLLLQPTALNTDHEGRLWVGCRGGRIVIFQH